MRRDELYLADIVEAADAIQRFLKDVDESRFVSDELLRSGVLHKLMIVGEAAARLSEAFRNEHPEIPWADIVGFRNIAVHAYFAVNWAIVWSAATRDAPELRNQIAPLLTPHGGDKTTPGDPTA